MVSRIACLALAAALAALVPTAAARAQSVPAADDSTAPPFAPSLDDWGEYGLLQTPSAHMGKDGAFNFTFSHVHPYDRYNVFFTPLPWAQMGFRYTAINNREFLPGDTQSYKDKSFDLRIRLTQESADFPETAIGFRDVAGTGLFSGEYLVFSRRYYDFDFSGGMGWGYLSNRATFGNPLGLISNSFKIRPSSSQAGAFTLDYFRGPNVGLFGGFEYHTPIKGVSLKLEFDPNNYKNEPLNNSFSDPSPINAAVVYRPYDFVEMSAGVERGNTAMLRITLGANFNSLGVLHDQSKPPALVPRPTPPEPVGQPFDEANLPRVADASPPPIEAAPASSPALPPAPSPGLEASPAPAPVAPTVTLPASEADVALRVFADLKTIGFRGESFAMEGNHAWLRFSQSKYHVYTIALGRAARIVAADAPAQIEVITLDLRDNNLAVASVTLMRRDLENAVAEKGSPEEIFEDAKLAAAAPEAPPGIANSGAYPYYDWSLNPHTRQQLGGTSNFLIYEVYAELAGTAHVAPGLDFSGVLGADLVDNVNQLTVSPSSSLPHVRSDIASYLKDGKTGLYQASGDYLFNLAPSWYGRVSAGYLEYMYAGVDSEVLYRPYDSRLAVGLDLNHVMKRNFNDLFGLQAYQVTEGQLTFYYKLPFYDTTAALHVGRYLAGDKGATIELSRLFAGGVRAGIFATKTNVSAAQFGEGSFDKGFFISFPLDLLLSTPSRDEASYVYRPLTRDGGQYLSISKPLYQETDGYDPQTLSRMWPQLLN